MCVNNVRGEREPFGHVLAYGNEQPSASLSVCLAVPATQMPFFLPLPGEEDSVWGSLR